jgi:CDP-glucose 4,6-dehydratase
MAGTTLVTGAGGFIGAWLTKSLLERGEAVIALDRPAPTSRDGIDRDEGPLIIESRTLELLDLDDAVIAAPGGLDDPNELTRTFRAHHVSTVFHLAAEPIVDAVRAAPRAAFETNVRGTWNVLEACQAADVERVVVASSDKAYGRSDDLPYTEDTPLRPTAPYEASKAAADLIARSYWPTYGLPVAVTRFANVYGGGDLNFSRLVPEAVCAALSGRSAVLRSDGSPERDFLYIDDAVAAYLAIADNLDSPALRGEAFNAGGGEPHRVSDVIDLINRIADTDAEPAITGDGTPDGEIDRQFVDSTKLRSATGWQAEVELADGLRRATEWYASHPSARPASRPAETRDPVNA